MNCARRQSGLSLVSTMIGLSLSLGLITTLTAALLELHQNVRIAVDRADTLDRARFVTELLADAVHWAGVPPTRRLDGTPLSTDTMTAQPRGLVNSLAGDAVAMRTILGSGTAAQFDLCALSEAAINPFLPAIGLLDVGADGSVSQAPCFNSASLLPGSQLIFVDSLRSCVEDCIPALPAWLLLSPGCNFLFTHVQPEVRRVSSYQLPADCSRDTATAVLERQLFFVRDYAWQQGDGIPALMLKRWLAETPARWSRAEMLAAGVSGLRVALIHADEVLAACAEDPDCLAQQPPLGLMASLLVRGWVSDSSHNTQTPLRVLGESIGVYNDGFYRLQIDRTMLRSTVNPFVPGT